MNKSTLYLLFSVIGGVIPWVFLAQFLGEPQPLIAHFFLSAFVNNVASSFATDLIISALVFFIFVVIEGKRLKMRRLWIYVVATLGVGLSFGLPLFLYAREKRLENR